MRRNKAIINLSAISACLVLSSCGVKIVTSKDFKQKEIKITTQFDAIDTYSTTDIEFAEGEPSMTLYASEKVIDKIEVYVKNGTLIVTQPESQNFKGFVASKLRITYPGKIKKFITGGTGDITIDSYSTDSLSLICYGTGDIECKKLNADFIFCETAGTGDIEIKNLFCRSANLLTEGTGDIEIKGINADFIEATTLGTGDIILTGSCRNLSQKASGTGDIDTKALKIND